MIKSVRILFFILLFSAFSEVDFKPNNGDASLNYSNYHLKVIKAEAFIVDENYQAALSILQGLRKNYSFIFVREYKVATQLAVALNKKDEAIELLEAGIRSGWGKKSIRKNSYLSEFLKEESVKQLMAGYEGLHESYEKRLNVSLRNQVHEMFKKDQKLAIKALFKLSSSAQDRYAEKKFAPHSERQMNDLAIIMDKLGFPGEKIIGNNIWMSTILSHHNSISQAYVLQDSLYFELRPKLLAAINKGELSPQEFALMDEWRFATMTNPTEASYGFLEPPFSNHLSRTDSLRAAIGLRNVKLRNQLVAVEDRTGMNLYLFGSPWVKGKIELR